MRLQCWYCHQPVSTELPEDTVFRAIAVCPDCAGKSSDLDRAMTDDVICDILMRCGDGHIDGHELINAYLWTLLDTTYTRFATPAEAEAKAAELRRGDPGWSYRVVKDPSGIGDCFIEIRDEDDDLMARY